MNHYDPDNPIARAIARILTGATCQRDLDARIGDFVAACADEKITATPGRFVWNGEGPPILDGWIFDLHQCPYFGQESEP
jgi:hypothetical protein